MRLSVRSADKGYSHKAFGAKVFVDGKECALCHTADEEEGVAYCYATNEHGEAYMDPENPGQIKEIEVRGEVRIVLKDED